MSYKTIYRILLSAGLIMATAACERLASKSVEESIQLAKDLDAKGDFKGTVIELKNAAQRDPNNPQVRLMLGETYLRAKIGDDAVKELRQASKLGVGETTINPLLAEALLLSRDYKQVLDEIHTTENASQQDKARVFQLHGDALIGLGKPKDGCTYFEKALQTDPSWYKAHIGKAKCTLAVGSPDEAKALLLRAIQLSPESSDAWLALGQFERSQGNFKEARQALDKAIKLNNYNIDALAEHGATMIAIGDNNSANKDAEKINHIQPKHYLAVYLKALIATQERNFALARDLTAKVLQASPSHTPSLLLAGSIEYELGHYQYAASYLNKVIQIWPRHPYATKLLAATELHLGDPKEAARLLSTFGVDQSNDTSLLALAADISLAERNFTQAIRYLERAASLAPNNAPIRAQLGNARLAAEDPTGLDDLKLASTLDLKWDGADRELIVAQIRLKKYADALKSIDSLERKKPRTAEVPYYRGLIYLDQKDKARARKNFEEGLKINPGHIPTVSSLARLDLLDNKPDAAKKRFEAVLDLDKKNLQALLALADLAKRQQNSKEYLRRLQQALEAAPGNVLVLSLLSELKQKSGDNANALLYARQAVDANPNDPRAVALLGRIQMLSGDLTNALSTHKKLVELQPHSADALLKLALVQFDNKDTTSAKATLLRAQQINPHHAGVLDALSRIALLERKHESALDLARQIQMSHPDIPLGYEREGDALFARGSFDKALASYERAFRLKQTSPVFIKIATTNYRIGNSTKVQADLRTWLTQHPQDNLVRAFAAEYYMTTKQNQEAVRQYEYLSRIMPGHAGFLNNLALLYLQNKDSRAQQTAERALKLEPQSPALQDTLGWILVENGKVQEGLELLRKASVSKIPSIRFHYVVALHRNGNITEALKELKSLLASGASFPEKEAAQSLARTLQ